MIRKQAYTENIDTLIWVGATISRQCRNCWTGEQLYTRIPFGRVIAGGMKHWLALEAIGLLAVEDIADLRQIGLVKIGQHSWSKEEWEKRILEAVQ